MAYKLVEYAGKGRLKLSTKKVLYPGRKQVFRQYENGRIVRDVIARFDESLDRASLFWSGFFKLANHFAIPR